MGRKGTAAALERADRLRKVVGLRIAGASYNDIANSLGITRQRAYQLVKEALDESETKLAEDVNQLRALELRRTESLLTSLWANRAQSRVADTILRVMDRRAKLLGLDAPSRSEEKVQAVVRFEVVTGIDGAPGELPPAIDAESTS